MRAIRNLYVENEVTYKTCDSCDKRKIVYPRLAGAYADILECAGNGRVWVYLCSECLQALRERGRCRCEFNINMTTIQAEMPLGFMLVGLGRPGFWRDLPVLSLRGFSPLVIARSEATKQSLFPIFLSLDPSPLST
jgi:hypothetical protein